MRNYTKNILKWLICAYLPLIMASCGVCRKSTNVVREEIHHIYRDSTVINIKDSTVLIPVEKVINVTLPDQVSELETSLATSKAYTDTLGLLHHNLENKKGITFSNHIEEHLTEKTDTVYIEKPVPYEVVVKEKYIPKYYRFTSYWFIVTLLLIIFLFLLKIQKAKSIL